MKPQSHRHCSFSVKSFKKSKKQLKLNNHKNTIIKEDKQKEYSEQVYRKFLHILNARRQRFLKQHLVQYYGKNFPIEHRQHYLFEQEWENKGRDSNNKKINSINESNSLLQLINSLLTVIIYSFTVWITNLDLIFTKNNKPALYYQTYALAFSLAFYHFIIGVFRSKSQDQQAPKIIEVVKSHYSQIIIILYFVTKLFGVNGFVNTVWMLFQLSVLFILYQKSSQMYQSIRLANFSLQYEYQIKVLDMIITVFIVAHFMVLFSITKAIVLYLTTHLSPQNNWMTALSIDKADEYVLYTYSFYFCTTTIMTVGYGDITPKNQYEVTVVILVQIFGVIVLGYIINQIGYCVSSLRRSQQLIEKDLSVVEKIKKHYKMSDNSANKVRQYILNSKPNINQLSPDEQQSILVKLNEQIKLDVVTQNMLSVIKSSLFFICRWSKNFQSSISSRLIHVLFNPNDVLYQPLGNQRIYIIKAGKIDIHAGKNTRRLHKVLKTINNEKCLQVWDNCYGYTEVISIRKPKIYAVSKGYTSAYYIDGQKLKDCAHQRLSDLQFYHQLKTKIDQARLCQSIEIKSLQSTKHHYSPTRSLLIKKETSTRRYQERRHMIRRQKDAFHGNKQVFDEAAIQQIKNKFLSSYATFDEDSQTEKIKTNNLTNLHTIKQDFCVLTIDKPCVQTFLDHYFESSKEYSNYFMRNNKSQILKKLEVEQFIHIQ